MPTITSTTIIMTATLNALSDHDSRVLILAPRGRDADLVAASLADVGVACHICSGAIDVVHQLRLGAAAAVISEEALGEAEIQRIASALESQPRWSDLPIIVLTGGGEPNRA